MIFGMSDSQRALRHAHRKLADSRWRAWFAWYPVVLNDGREAWLSTVTTCKPRDCSVWQYRPLTPSLHS